MDLAEDLRASLQEILVRGAVELHENGSRSTPAWPLSWEVRGMLEKPLLHLWPENCHVARRVLAITHHAEDRLALAVERFGRLKPERMEIVSVFYDRGAKEIPGKISANGCGGFLRNNFPTKPLGRSPLPRTSNIPCLGSTHAASCAAVPPPSRFWLSRNRNRRMRWNPASPMACYCWGVRANPCAALLWQRCA